MAFEAPEIEISSNAGDPSDIRNISGTVSLPTGAATAARQDTGNNTLATIDGKTPSLVAGSTPVLTKNSSNVETGTAAAPYRVDPTGTTTQPVSGTVTANAGTNLNTSALALEATQGTQNTRIGDLTESAPASDTASSGLNGRLQRIAQRLTSLINLLPISIGQKNAAGSLSVVLSSDNNTVNVNNISGTVSLPSGAATSALQTTGNTSLGSIDTKLNSITTAPVSSAAGIVVRPVTVEYPTFTAVSIATVVGNNKSMLAIQNTGSAVVRVREIWIINDQTTGVTGVAGSFEVRRIASFTGGTAITPVTYDTADALPAGITASTGSTVATETSLLRQGVYSTDEWGPGTADVESFDHAIQNTTPFFSQPPNGKALTIRQNEGLHIKFATNSTAGAFNIRIIFTTE